MFMHAGFAMLECGCCRAGFAQSVLEKNLLNCCVTSATIVSGAVAERLQLGGYCIFCFAMTSFVYPVIVAWTWSCKGWLNYVGAGYMDFAGSGVVHLTGGIGALVGCKIV